VTRTASPPDLLTISKTLGGGIPLAATATTAAIEEKAYREGFFFFTSHLNEAIARRRSGSRCSTYIAEEKLVDAARDKGAYLKQGLLALKEAVRDRRRRAAGEGSSWCVDFVKDRQSKRPAEAEAEAITREVSQARSPSSRPRASPGATGSGASRPRSPSRERRSSGPSRSSRAAIRAVVGS
jgi:2,2-dialkylglycine decarboxylase (pyruvate)